MTDGLPAYEGFHDVADCEWIAGWAWNPAEPDRPVDVEIHADDVLLARITADEVRPDLVRAGKGNGRHGFQHALPFWLKDRRTHRIRVRVAGTEVDLAGTNKEICCESKLLGDIRETRERIRSTGADRGSAIRRPLAVFAPYVGGLSETFIRRHMEALLPNGTVVVTNTLEGPYGGHWRPVCPTLVVDPAESGGAESRVEEFLRRHGVEVVLGEYLNESLALLSTVKRIGRRFVAHAHGYDVSELLRDEKWRAAYRRYAEADAVVTMSRVSQSRLVEVGLPFPLVHVIPYGVDVPPGPASRPPRAEVRCAAVGRMVSKKGPVLTLDAFRRAAEAMPNLRLDFVGGGALLPAARQFVQAFGLRDRVRLHGSQPPDTVSRLLAEADVFLQHSITDPDTGDEEGLPVAVLEAMARSLPVVSTRHAGIPEAVVDGATGYLVEEGDTAGMAEHLVRLARDPELRRRLGEAGWRRARECFAWDRERSELLGLLGLADRSSDSR